MDREESNGASRQPQKGRVQCSLQSNTERKRPNSELCSPSHRVRRAKRVSCAIWSRPTRRLPKMKTGWRPISIRRSSAERIATTVPSSPRKKAQDLKRLGTTVTMRRNTAPTTLQRKLFDYASTLGENHANIHDCHVFSFAFFRISQRPGNRLLRDEQLRSRQRSRTSDRALEQMHWQSLATHQDVVCKNKGRTTHLHLALETYFCR
jgi:hypothetical protein